MANEIDDEMARIVKCRHCGDYEYYGEMRWLNGWCGCRKCYKHKVEEEIDHKPYKWHDLDGPVPTEQDFLAQEEAICNDRGRKVCDGCEHQHEQSIGG